MLSKTLNYISHHAIAIVALICSLLALAGASYAAIKLPKNSVGNQQIKRGAVAPPKFSKQIGGYVRAYAVIGRNGKLVYSSPQARLSNWHEATTTPSGGQVVWPMVVSKRCQAMVTPIESVAPTPVSVSLGTGGSSTAVSVLMNNGSGAVVAVVC